MTRCLALLIGLCLTGCQSDVRRVDEFGYVAYSWTGGNIVQMIDAWGKPRGGHKEALDDRLGYARWRAFSRAGGRLGGVGYECEVIARFDTSGKIAEVEIVHSYHCKRHYGEDLSPMLRPGAKPLPGTNVT